MPVLERIALHQTRLHTPGLGLDGKGVALGTKGLVLLASIDRLVALLAAYTREHSLAELQTGLAMNVVRSRLGTREMTLEFAAESSDRMDHIAQMARLVGGYTFTGTTRHFVQYRDAAAPFGYDATDLLSTDAPLALYHDQFSQTYQVERAIDLRGLVLRLMPRPEPPSKGEGGARILVAEQGLGPALVHYLVRSRVQGEVCVVEWQPESDFDDAPHKRWLFRVPEVPERMLPLLRSTPGIVTFVPAGAGVAVEIGHRHPLELRACPVFDPAGLALLRGGGREPWLVERLPAMGALSSFARVELRTGEEAASARQVLAADPVRVPLRVMPGVTPRRRVTATWIATEQLPLLRRLAYALPRGAIAQTTVASTNLGVFLRCKTGIESIPLGRFFVELHPNLFVPAGYDVTPAIAPDLLARALDVPSSQVLFIDVDAHAWTIEESAFGSLDAALLAAPPWEPLTARAVERSLEEAAIDLRVQPVGLFPLRGVEAVDDERTT